MPLFFRRDGNGHERGTEHAIVQHVAGVLADHGAGLGVHAHDAGDRLVTGGVERLAERRVARDAGPVAHARPAEGADPEWTADLRRGEEGRQPGPCRAPWARGRGGRQPFSAFMESPFERDAGMVERQGDASQRRRHPLYRRHSLVRPHRRLRARDPRKIQKDRRAGAYPHQDRR